MSGLIECITIDGRPGTASFLTSSFKPSDREHAELTKIIFDDGDLLVLVRDKPKGG